MMLRTGRSDLYQAASGHDNPSVGSKAMQALRFATFQAGVMGTYRLVIILPMPGEGLSSASVLVAWASHTAPELQRISTEHDQKAHRRSVVTQGGSVPNRETASCSSCAYKCEPPGTLHRDADECVVRRLN
jgi:hypothetical protein